MRLEKSLSHCNKSLEKYELYSILDGTVAIYAMKRPGSDRDNQDSCAIIPLSNNKAILALADGVGGARGGDVASRLAIETLIEGTRNYKDDDENGVRHLILEAFEKANQKIRDLGIGAGSTFVVAELEKTYVRFYSIGDSTGQLYGGKGSLKYRSIEHSPTGLAYEAGVMEEKEALLHADGNILLYALGDPNLKMEISSAIDISERDIVLLASDGLTSNLTEEEIASLITSGTIGERATRIITSVADKMNFALDNDLAIDQLGHPDDFSLILFGFSRSDVEEA